MPVQRLAKCYAQWHDCRLPERTMDTLQFNETTSMSTVSSEPTGSLSASIEMLQGIVSRGFGIRFSFFDGETGNLLSPIEDLPSCDSAVICELAREVARRDTASLIAESGPIVVFAIPFVIGKTARQLVAVAPFLIDRPPTEEIDIRTKSDAQMLLVDYAREAGIDTEAARAVDVLTAWADRTTISDPETLLRTAQMTRDLVAADMEVAEIREEANQLANDLSQTYEEICLFHRLAQYLKISSTPKELADIAMNWLLEVLPVESIVVEIQLPDNNLPDDPHDDLSIWTTNEKCPLNHEGFDRLIEYLSTQGRFEHGVPVVVNRSPARLGRTERNSGPAERGTRIGRGEHVKLGRRNARHPCEQYRPLRTTDRSDGGHYPRAHVDDRCEGSIHVRP